MSQPREKISPSQLNEWVSDLQKTPDEYVEGRKGEFKNRVKAKLDHLSSQIQGLKDADVRSPAKWTTLVASLETKIDEITSLLRLLPHARVEKWEELYVQIYSGMDFLKKHLEKMGLFLLETGEKGEKKRGRRLSH